MNPRCLCCGRVLSPVACFDGWCAECVGRALHELLGLRDVKGAVIVADVLRQAQAPFLARVVMNE